MDKIFLVLVQFAITKIVLDPQYKKYFSQVALRFAK